jgi:hypothetical protein
MAIVSHGTSFVLHDFMVAADHKNVGRESLVDNFEAKNLKREYYEPVAADIAKLEVDDRFLKIDNL